VSHLTRSADKRKKIGSEEMKDNIINMGANHLLSLSQNHKSSPFEDKLEAFIDFSII
jgi:hypothetical protein